VRPLTFAALLLYALTGPLRAGQIEAPVSGSYSPGTQTGAIGSSLGAPAPIQLTIPALNGPLAPAFLAAGAPVAIQPAAVVVAAVQPAVIAHGVPVLPQSLLTPVQPNPSKADAAPDAPEAADAGRVRFDQSSERAAAPASAGLWGKVRGFLSIGEAAPAWPGKSGDAVRIGRFKTTLQAAVSRNATSAVWRPADANYTITLVHPSAREEAAKLRAIAASDLPVAKLYAESRDGLALVREFIDGATGAELLARGPFRQSHTEGWGELAAKLIKSGMTADLAPGSLAWQHWRTRWVVTDAASLTKGGPRDVLDQLLEPALLARAGIDPAEFLAGLRARLGPDSALWAGTLAELRASKVHAPALAALARRDAKTPAGPSLVFTAAAKGPAGLDDTVVKPAELQKRLGWDPLTAKHKIKLHGDDPGKLNTKITLVEQPGKPKIVVKEADWHIIRNEVALRRLVRRFFGRYVRVPGSLAVERGYESYMVMENLDAAPAHYSSVFSLEQRVALALLVRTFGVGDVNQGNVLAANDKGLPWLIDFEQAMGRTSPVAGRLPDERIALEMPWMSRFERNRVEDYQPGIRAWRAHLAKAGTRAEILSDLAASGFTPAEAANLSALFDVNAADLDWTLQNDADFVNQFVVRNAAKR
jgi:hypothetical protein